MPDESKKTRKFSRGDMATKTTDWLKQKMAEHGIRPIDVARIIGTNRQTVDKILKRGRRITAEELLKLQAHMQQLDISKAESGQETGTRQEKPQSALGVSSRLPSVAADDGKVKQPHRIAYIKVVGEVAAGAWKDVTLADFEEYTIPIVHDPRWPKEALRARVVRGPSINRQARDGDIVLTLDIHQAPRDYQVGDWVIVERERLGEIETTVKRVGIDPETGKTVLLPDSDHPAHQTPLVIDNGDPNITVRVTEFVLDFIRQATRF